MRTVEEHILQNVRAYCILYNELKERYEELRGTEE